MNLQVMTAMATSTEYRAASPDELAVARATLASERRRVAALALFARRMSHDMSNFVTVVRTYSELLLADLPDDGPVRSDVLEIHRAADAMIDYMQRIARFARTTYAVPGTIAPDEVIADAIKEIAGRERVRANFGCASGVHMDGAILGDCVRELIANAFEASSAGSPVQLRTSAELLPEAIVDGGLPIDAGSWAVIEIVDEGPGFAEDIRADALDPFVTTKHAVRGAGFGLALARSAAWSTGGQLVVESTSAQNVGARVRLWLPAVPR